VTSAAPAIDAAKAVDAATTSVASMIRSDGT
jgi:hypothetical protein